MDGLEVQWSRIGEVCPDEGAAVLVYFGGIVWRDMNGQPTIMTPLRDHVERTAPGFYEGGTWHESGTAHDMFEDWRSPDQHPTHWMPLPPPPKPATR